MEDYSTQRADVTPRREEKKNGMASTVDVEHRKLQGPHRRRRTSIEDQEVYTTEGKQTKEEQTEDTGQNKTKQTKNRRTTTATKNKERKKRRKKH